MRRALYLLGGLSDQDIQWIADRATKDYVTRGAVLIEEGLPVDAIYIVLDGRFLVSTGAREAKEVAQLYAGDVVGEISFVDSYPPSASVTALRDSHILSLARDILQNKLESDTGFAARFYKALAGFLATRLRATTAQLGYGAAVERVHDPDELDDDMIDRVSLAATRFDDLLKHCRLPVEDISYSAAAGD